ncbi:MAG: glycosyltransferase [Planctomycetes bacterium]|nr:glycosyltransferase [Planctomycetota bacterium]
MRNVLVVVPCYNEAQRLDAAAFAAYAAAEPGVRFLFVDDGSQDATAQVLAALVARCPERLQFVSLSRNGGKAEAVRQGFLRAFAAEPAPDAVAFWDADLATPLADIGAFAEVLERSPRFTAVFGSRVNLLGRDVRRKLWRHYLGRVFATAASAVLRLPIYDTQCGAKLLRNTAAVRAVFAERFVSPWIFDVEILARLGRELAAAGGPPLREVVYEFPLMVWRDVAGSKVRLRHFVTVFFDLLRIWWRGGRPR